MTLQTKYQNIDFKCLLFNFLLGKRVFYQQNKVDEYQGFIYFLNNIYAWKKVNKFII